MTTPRELGEYLIEAADNGRVIQLRSKNKINCGWADLLASPGVFFFNTEQDEYRLKPKVTFYRVFECPDGTLGVDEDSENFDQFGEWTQGISGYKHIHDFEIES